MYMLFEFETFNEAIVNIEDVKVTMPSFCSHQMYTVLD